MLYYDNGDSLDLVGFNGGTAYIRANIGYERYYWDEFTESCTDEGWDDSGYVNGQAQAMKVTGMSPDRALVGTSPRITISGRGFGNSSSTSVEGDSGLTVNNDDNFSVNDTQISANMTIATNATPGTHHLTVHVGDVDDTVDFFVQIPKALVRQAFPAEYQTNVSQQSTGISTLMPLTDGSVIGFDGQAFEAPVGTPLTHRCGGYRLFLYQLVDQGGNPIKPGSNVTVTINETFTDQSGDTGGNVSKGNAPTNNAGYVADINGLLKAGGSCLSSSIQFK